MKNLKVILLLLVICKASILPSMDLGGFMTDSCHSQSIVKRTSCSDHPSSDDEDDQKGCCNSGCDCLCCGHIFTLDEAPQLAFAHKPTVVLQESQYSFVYAFAFNKGVWQPPRYS